MKYMIHVNQMKAAELGIDGINQAHIFDLLTFASVWAKTEIIDNQVYYWVSRSVISEELPILKLKSDTVYRHLKKLADIGLIFYKKVGKKDCIKVTKKGKKYISSTMSEIDPNHYVGNRSEKTNNSDSNPKKLGNRSEKTRIEIRHINTTKDQDTNNPVETVESDAPEFDSVKIVSAKETTATAFDKFSMFGDWKFRDENWQGICQMLRYDESELTEDQQAQAFGDFLIHWLDEPSAKRSQSKWQGTLISSFRRWKSINEKNNPAPATEFYMPGGMNYVN